MSPVLLRRVPGIRLSTLPLLLQITYSDNETLSLTPFFTVNKEGNTLQPYKTYVYGRRNKLSMYTYGKHKVSDKIQDPYITNYSVFLGLHL